MTRRQITRLHARASVQYAKGLTVGLAGCKQYRGSRPDALHIAYCAGVDAGRQWKPQSSLRCSPDEYMPPEVWALVLAQAQR